MDTHKKTVTAMFHSVEQVVGTDVMHLVAEHAAWKTKERYEDAARISFSEDGGFGDGLAELTPERAQIIIDEFVGVLTATLGRLVGEHLAMQLTQQPSAATEQVRGRS